MKDPVRILFDTDIGSDCDDAGALALLHSLCDRGEAQLLAVTACYCSPWVAGCIDAINRYRGRCVPVGINLEQQPAEAGVYARALCEEFPNDYPASGYEQFPDTLRVLRAALADAPDAGVVFVVTGSLDSARRLLLSPPDDLSPLDGVSLIRRKIRRTVVMGGRFRGSWPMPVIPGPGPEAEWNIRANIPSAACVCRSWPGELVFSSYEIGLWCVTLRDYARTGDPADPARRAYELHPVGRTGRESWDLTAVLEAVRPGTYWNLHPWGRVTVDDSGVTAWTPDARRMHSYLLPRTDYDTIREEIDRLVMG